MLKHTGTNNGMILIDLATVTNGRKAEPLVREVMKYVSLMPDSDCHAIVSIDDHEGLAVCQEAQCQVTVVHNPTTRSTTLRQLLRRLTRQINNDPPLMFLAVTNDPNLADLCDEAVQAGVPSVSVLGSGESPPELLRFNYRPVELLVPEYQQHLIYVYVDFENWVIPYLKLGIEPPAEQFIAAYQRALESEGKVVGWWAYADWGLLQRTAKTDYQRELARLGVNTTYQINMRNKNSADMKIVEDLRSKLESGARFGAAMVKFALATNDRDFRPLIETAKANGREIILVARSDGMAHELRQAASKIYYADSYLPRLGQPRLQQTNEHRDRSLAVLVMSIETWLTNNRWKWVYADRLVARLQATFGGTEGLRQAIEADVMRQVTRTMQYKDGNQGTSNTYELNHDHPLVKATQCVAHWLPIQFRIYLEERRMPYVDTAFLAKGMQMSPRCLDAGVGLDREDAEFWLGVAADAGVIVARRQPHPKSPDKLVTTWWPARTSNGTEAKDVQVQSVVIQAGHLMGTGVVAVDKPLDSATIRRMLTDGFGIEELRTLAYDDFRPVYEQLGSGMTKSDVVHLLVEHAERRRQIPQLISSLRQRNPAGVNQYLPQAA